MTREDPQSFLPRRKLLAACGSAVTVGLAGCADLTDTDDTSPEETGDTTTPSETPSETSTPGEAIITDTTVPQTAPSDEQTTVMVTLHNPGDEAVSELVSLSVNRETITTETVDLSGGEETTVDMVIPAEVTFDGEYTVDISTSDDTYESVLYIANPNPYGKQTLVVGLEQETPARHDMQGIVREALTYWENYSEQFAGYPIEYDYRPNTNDPDVLIRLVEDIHMCGGHTGEIAGCAPLIRDRVPEPAEIRIVDGYRREWITTTLKHELGHTLGLDHDDEPAHIMSDEIEDRIPDYTERQEALDAYDYAFIPYLNGVQSWNRAMDAWERGDYGTTEAAAINTYDYLAESGSYIETAGEIANDLNETDAEDLLVETRVHIELVQLAAEEAIKMAREADEMFGNPEPYRENLNSYIDESNQYTSHEPEEVIRAFGFPVKS